MLYLSSLDLAELYFSSLDLDVLYFSSLDLVIFILAVLIIAGVNESMLSLMP